MLSFLLLGRYLPLKIFFITRLLRVSICYNDIVNNYMSYDERRYQMTNLKKLTNDQCSEVFYNLIENHKIESYEDASMMCLKLREFAIACISATDTDDAMWDIPELDDVAKQNLTHVAHLLDICSSMFIQTDDYYRTI